MELLVLWINTSYGIIGTKDIFTDNTTEKNDQDKLPDYFLTVSKTCHTLFINSRIILVL
jgi:hypothetical protein